MFAISWGASLLTERLGSPDVKHKINLTVCVHERKSADDFFLLSSSVILNFCATSHFLNVEVLKDAPQEIYINKKSSSRFARVFLFMTILPLLIVIKWSIMISWNNSRNLVRFIYHQRSVKFFQCCGLLVTFFCFCE